MGTLNDYRLGDWYYTENELAAMDAELLDGRMGRYDTEPTKESVCIFRIVSKNGDTGKVWIGRTPDVILTMNALNRVWSETGLKFVIGKVGKPTYGADKLVEAIKIVLLPWKYETKFATVVGSDSVYRYEEWIGNLILA